MNKGLLLTGTQGPILQASFDSSGQNGEESAEKRPKAKPAWSYGNAGPKKE